MKIVLALGGNALGNSVIEQKQNIAIAAKTIVNFVKQGNDIVVGHGNGPQIGMINNVFNDSEYDMPFPECGAMSQGYIGFHLQNLINKELKNNDIDKNVATILTQVEVYKGDSGFDNPTKPIGPFMTCEQARELKKMHPEYTLKEISSGKYRRVVASPLPVDIVEKEIIKQLVDNKNIVIACGGGGIPVIKDGHQYIGVDAVIDKDFACEKLAELVNADCFIILTAVDKVSLNFEKENQVDLDSMSILECNKYLEENQFGIGSMLPKILAAKKFVEETKNDSFIVSLENADKAILGLSGTKIHS